MTTSTVAAGGRARRCVILDIGGVLEFTPATGWAGRWERRLGLAGGAVAERLGDVWTAGAVGRVTEAQVRGEVAARLGLDASGADELLADLWTEYLGSPNEELIAYVRALRAESACGLGILSNSFVGATARERAAYGFDTLVDQVLYSHETGLLKPDPRAYALACERLRARPADCLFLDDHAPNVAAAEAAGLPAHHFRTTAAAIAAITEHLTVR